jgi:hypothetical protein
MVDHLQRGSRRRVWWRRDWSWSKLLSNLIPGQVDLFLGVSFPIPYLFI